jgi:hypothetical protein
LTAASWNLRRALSLTSSCQIFNLVAYAFADAILVTPMGALTIVVTGKTTKEGGLRPIEEPR